MKKQYGFIDIIDEGNRVSSLQVYGKENPDKLRVVGGLDHCTYFEPASIRDANALIQWLKNWIDNKAE